MPFAPPDIHLIFPQMCGSGKKGAKPKVRQSKIATLMSFKKFNGFYFKIEFTNLSMLLTLSLVKCLIKALPIIAPFAY